MRGNIQGWIEMLEKGKAAEALEAMKEYISDIDDAAVAYAQSEFADEETQFDDPVTSRGADGSWVQGWMFVDKTNLGCDENEPYC